MANDVVIEVEARVGDAIAQMTLTAAAVRALGDEASSASTAIGDDTDRRSLSSRLSRLRYTLGNLGDRGPLGMVIRGFGNLASAMLAPLDLGVKFASQFEQIGSIGQALIGIISTVTIGWFGFAAAIAAVTFAATAAATVLGTLVAIVADLVAPVTLLGGLLGGLGVGFFIAAKRAAEGGVHLHGFAERVSQLGDMFHRTSTLLAQRFLPYLNELADAGKQALHFLDKIIKLPLEQAFKAIDTQGVRLLGKFVDRVAEVLSKPIKLAFHVAFGDTAFSNMVADWWHRFTGFLFGYTESHPIVLHGKTIKFEERTVDGVFQPFINWFNRHHFTQQGIKIGQQILGGLMTSGFRDRLGKFLVDVIVAAGKQAFHAFMAAAGAAAVWVTRKMGELANAIRQKIGDAASNAGAKIRSALGAAWDWVKNRVSSIWDYIVGLIERPFHINIDWPSPPSWLTSFLGGGAGGSGGPIHPGPSPNPTSGGSGGNSFRPAMAMAAPMVVVNVHGADLSDAPTRRRIGQQIGKEIAADWRRRAGGH